MGPALLCWTLLKVRLRDIGLSVKGIHRHLPLYALMYVLIFPLVWLASKDEAFLRTYPFADSARDGFWAMAERDRWRRRPPAPTLPCSRQPTGRSPHTPLARVGSGDHNRIKAESHTEDKPKIGWMQGCW